MFKLAWFNIFRNPIRLWKEFRKGYKWFKEYEEKNPEFKKDNEKYVSAFIGLTFQGVILYIIVWIGVYLLD